jgi:hypothetical protein
MKAFVKPLAALVVVLAAAPIAGCVSTASDGRYQTDPRGGWDNFRAEAPMAQSRQPPVA